MNKRDNEPLNLKNAFSPTPEACRNALCAAARSVREEKKVKKNAWRAALIAAAILLITMALAFAAEQMGLINFFTGHYQGAVALPESAQKVLSATEAKTVTVGPVAFTLQETLCDGRLIYLTTRAEAANGALALLSDSMAGDVTMRISDDEAARLGVKQGLNYLEAAQAANVPLYSVSARMDVPDSYLASEEMLDMLCNPDGSLLLVHMAITDPARLPETLEIKVNLRVGRIDPQTGAELSESEERGEATLAIPVGGVLESKVYTPQGNAVLQGLTVQSVQAERTCAGVYMACTAQAPADADQDETIFTMYEWYYQDAQGARLPGGISLTGYMSEGDTWPVETVNSMLGLDALPDTLLLSGYETEETVTLK